MTRKDTAQLSGASHDREGSMVIETKYAKSAYRNFLFWSICSSLGVTVSTLVDASLVGNFIGSDGLAVANIATPVFLLYSLMGITLGGGAGVLIGKELGAANVKKANSFFASVLSTGIVVSVLFSLLSVIFRSELCTILGATPELLAQALQYLTVVFFCAPVFTLYHILSIAVRTDGEPKLAAAASVGVIVTNLGLDFLFMKGLNWGLIGASASLCIAEAVGVLLLLTHFVKKQALLALRLCMPTPTDITDFVGNGFGVGSAFIFQAIVMLVFNVMLLKNDSLNGVYFVAVFGVMYTVSTIPYAVFDGAGTAASSVISILAGEKDRKGMLAVFHEGLRITGIAGCLLAAFFIVSARETVSFFGIADDAAFDTAAAAFQIYAVSMGFAGINVLTTAFWQTIGRIRLASCVSILRNFIFMLVLGVWLITENGIMGLAMVYVISEVLCLLLVLLISIAASSKKYIDKYYAFPNRMFEGFYPIEQSSMHKLSEELEKVCEEWEMGYKESFFVSLIVEELILNIIKFGMNSTEKGHYVSVKLMDNEGEYILRIRDNVKTYNPFDLRGDEVDRAAMKLITEKSKYYNYQRKLVFNYLYIVL